MLFGKNRILGFFGSEDKETEKKVSKTIKHGSFNCYYITINQFYQQRLYPRSILGYTKIFSKEQNLEFTTAKLIESKDFALNCTYIDVVAAHGQPRIEMNSNVNFTTVFYKKNNATSKTLTQLHFLNDSLFYFSISFAELNIKEKGLLIEALQNKYNVIGIKNNTTIIDRDQNKITFQDDVYTRISFLSGNQVSLEALKNKCLELTSAHIKTDNPFNEFI